VNIAARLAGLAGPGGITVSDSVRNAVKGKVGAIDLLVPEKPSIAVLPFANMSGDPEQEFFIDGITEDIITELSRDHSWSFRGP
jgi:adenylate cyclase